MSRCLTARRSRSDPASGPPLSHHRTGNTGQRRTNHVRQRSPLSHPRDRVVSSSDSLNGTCCLGNRLHNAQLARGPPQEEGHPQVGEDIPPRCALHNPGSCTRSCSPPNVTTTTSAGSFARHRANRRVPPPDPFARHQIEPPPGDLRPPPAGRTGIRPPVRPVTERDGFGHPNARPNATKRRRRHRAWRPRKSPPRNGPRDRPVTSTVTRPSRARYEHRHGPRVTDPVTGP